MGQSKIDLETETKNARKVDYEVKMIKGDKYYYSEKVPTKYAEENVAQAIAEISAYKGGKSGEAIAADHHDSSDASDVVEGELDVPTPPAELDEAAAEAAAKKAEEEDKKYWEDKAAEEERLEKERLEYQNQVAGEAIQEAIQDGNSEL